MSFVASKVMWIFCSPGNLFVLLMLVGGFLSMSSRERWRIHGRRLCFGAAFLLFLIGVFPVGEWMLLPLENKFPPVMPQHVDGIILLGGDENARITEARDIPVETDSARRYIEFAALARTYPQAKLIFTGGTGRLVPNSRMNDSEVAKAALQSLGVPVDRMIFEDHSRNTHENATLTAEIVHPEPQQNWVLVTSAFHMPRSVGCFRKAGFTVYPAPVGFATTGAFSSRLEFDVVQHLAQMTYALHEYYGLVAYWLLGYTDSPWSK